MTDKTHFSCTTSFFPTSTDSNFTGLSVEDNYDEDDDTSSENDYAKNDGVDSSDLIPMEMKELPPEDRISWEKICDRKLQPLYRPNATSRELTVAYGGVLRTISSFHYCNENESAPSNIYRREYIDLNDKLELYRWDLKAILSTSQRVVSFLNFIYTRKQF